ncbi:putative uncharacterized protein [Clostridium sp. CAG:451]|nr:putative uncharacterized protein [Clostridium sp. CAG:451]
MRKSFKYCLTFILTAIICIVLLIVTALIPKELVKSNMVKSSEEMYDISYIYFFNNQKNRAFLIHNYPDPITFNLTYSLDSKKSFTSSILTKYYASKKFGEKVNVREKAYFDYKPNKEYYRYWHGNMFLVKALMLVFDYKNILIFLSVILIAFALLITYNLYRKNRLLALLFLISNLVCHVYVTFYCLEYIYMFLLSYIMSLIAFKLIDKDESKIICFFIIGGVLANFFDFLTTETLIFTLPFFIIFYFGRNKSFKDSLKFFLKSLIAFLLGYSLMWILKWLILIIIYKQSPNDFLNTHIEERGFSLVAVKKEPFKSIYDNLKLIVPFCYLNNNLVILIIICYICYVIWLIIRKKIDSKGIILLLISIIPMLRYFVLYKHSIDHTFFTYRALLPSIMIWIYMFFRKDDKYEKD